MEWQFTSTVTANTSPADILGTSVFGMVCIDSAGNISLVENHFQLVLLDNTTFIAEPTSLANER